MISPSAGVNLQSKTGETTTTKYGGDFCTQEKLVFRNLSNLSNKFVPATALRKSLTQFT